jgi:hypothetical protein
MASADPDPRGATIRGLFCSTRLSFVLIVLELEASFF